jgi:hypothetical protein
MPELPGQCLSLLLVKSIQMKFLLTLHASSTEVERAAALLRSIGLNKRIEGVVTAEDKIVYAGTTGEEFV